MDNTESGVDIIVCWPRNCDYPLWRWFVKQHRDFFKDVFVVFTETNQGHDYRKYVEKVMKDDNITFIQGPLPKGDEDWRNLAVNAALERSSANWVWFTEQDLFITHAGFWPMMGKYMLDYDMVGYKEGSRVHPANLWVKREWIDKSKKNFGVVKDVSDHFFSFYNNLRLQGINMKRIPYPNMYFHHMNGLSHNMKLLEDGEPIGYLPDEFLGYLQMCALQENLDPHFKEVLGKGIEALNKQLAA